MVPVLALWLPILLSAVVVFVVSALMHMVLSYHRNDLRPVPAEDELMEGLRRAGLEPGEYAIPHAATPEEMAEPAYVEKSKRGPVALITVLPSGPPSMAKSLTLWFAYTLVVGVIAAYVAGRALPPGADYLEVFRFTGTAALAGYVVGTWQQSIWYGRPWSTTLKASFDGLVFALLTAGVFGWLWPGAS